MYEVDRDKLINELEGIIFLNPDLYNENNPDTGWETNVIKIAEKRDRSYV